MSLTVPMPPDDPSNSIGVIDLDARRQNKALVERVAQLEVENGELRGRVVPAVSTSMDHTHSYACGFHPAVDVHEKSGKVTCRVCNEVLDPTLVLLQFALRERNFAYSINSLREEEKSLRKEVAALKIERSRLRSAIKKSKR